jgi:hypothetical protein
LKNEPFIPLKLYLAWSLTDKPAACSTIIMPASPSRKTSKLKAPYTKTSLPTLVQQASLLELTSSTARNPYVQQSQRIVACLRAVIAEEVPRSFPELQGRVKVTDAVSMDCLLESSEAAWNSCFPSKKAITVNTPSGIHVMDPMEKDVLVASTWAKTYYDLVAKPDDAWFYIVSSRPWFFNRDKCKETFLMATRLDALLRWFESRFCVGSMTMNAPTQSKLVWESIQGITWANGTDEDWNQVKIWVEKNGRAIATGRFIEQGMHYSPHSD